MKRRSSPSNENHKESQCQNTFLCNGKKQRVATVQPTTPPRPPSVCKSLPRKLHHSTTAECGPSQLSLKEVLLARKYKQQPLQPVTSTSKIKALKIEPMHSSTLLQPQKKYDPSAVTLSEQPAAEQQSHGVEEIHQNALNNLTELHDERSRMLKEIQNCQNQLHHLGTQLQEGNQYQRGQDNVICKLQVLVDRIQHNLMQHVESLKELLARTRIDSSSSGDCQNQDQGHSGRRHVETKPVYSVGEGTSSPSSDFVDDTEDTCTDFEEGQQQPNDKQTSKIYGIQDTIHFLNQTFTDRERTIKSLEILGASEFSGYATATDSTGTGIADGLLQIEALSVQVTAAISADETLLRPVIRKPPAPGRVTCPYCQKDLTKKLFKTAFIKEPLPKIHWCGTTY